MVLSLVALLAIVAVVLLLNPEPPQRPREDRVDVAAEAATVPHDDGDLPALAPEVPESWYANSARLQKLDGVSTWDVGWVVTDTVFAGLQQAEDGGTLWFLTRATSDVAADAPQRPVNVAVQDKDFWASLAGHGQLVRDDARKKEFWNSATEAFFGEGSSPEDPQIVLVRVDVNTAQFWESPGAVATAVEMVKAKVTGGTAEPGDSETVRF